MLFLLMGTMAMFSAIISDGTSSTIINARK